jgi:hypothetical protein
MAGRLTAARCSRGQCLEVEALASRCQADEEHSAGICGYAGERICRLRRVGSGAVAAFSDDKTGEGA